MTVKNGLPSNKVYHSLIDSRGFVWFATDNGLCRYDGLRFKVFKNDEKDSCSIPEDVIGFVYEISYDEILIITGQGILTIYDYRTGKFKKLEDKKNWIKYYSISNFYRDKKNNFWFATNFGLIKADIKFNFIKEYKIPDKVKGHHLSNLVNLICEDRNGIFWLGMFYRGVVRFDPVKEEFDTKNISTFIPHVQTGGIVASQNSDYVFIATGGEGLYMVNINNFSYTQWTHKKKDNKTLSTDILTDICFQNNDILWIGSLEGISKFDLKNNVITNYKHNPDKPFSLINNLVNHLFCDPQGILWISTFGGISKLNTMPERFTKISVNNSLVNSLSSNKVIGCYVDKNSNLWLATSLGIDVLEPGLQKIHHYTLPKSFTYHANDEVVRFYLDRQNNFWIGTWGGGISRTKIPKNFKPGDKLSFKNFYYDSLKSNSISSNFIRSFAEDGDDNLWITTWNGGINIIDASEKKSENIKFKRVSSGKNWSKNLASNYVDEILSDKFGNLWFCTSQGLQRFNSKNNEFQMMYADRDGIKNLINSSTHVLIDEQNNIWNSSFAGLTKITKNTTGKYSFKIIYKDKFRGINTMIQDDSGVIWFSTLNSEIGSFNPVNGRLKFYSMIEEVDGCDFYFGFPSKDKDGTLYFPSFSGLLYFNPGRLTENKKTPPVYITSLQIAGDEYKANCDITQLKKMELDYDQSNITVGFASLNYLFPEENEFKYILKGLDKNWKYLGSKSEINFASLRPGNYQLKVIGSNNDGYWNNEAACLTIIVHPPFYRNSYFIVLSVLTIIFVSALLVYKKIKNLRAEKEQQLNFSKLLIESQEEERKRLSNELHDSLGQNLLVIRNLLYLYNSVEEKNEDDLFQISDLIKESIDEVKAISANLHPHQLERLGLNKAVGSMINKIMKATNITISYDRDEVTGLIPFENEINIFRIIQESINNIVKHSGADKASVKIKKRDNSISISIEDNGKGLDLTDQEIQSKLTEGLGLKSIRERARLINGKLFFESVPTGGTKVLVEIKLNRNFDKKREDF
ncbi:MAG: two-component regulator propeller domain-containing protein [Ignavibacteria bacterium]|nr:two-component regulator propeller domain-containing protein [Ignavibacteria bacterium]